MTDHDRDLITALAEGHLSTAAAENATSRIEADPELASEYAYQVAALQFLQSSTAPRLTTAERSALRANLMEKLGIVTVASPPARKRTQWWVPVFGFATAAAVVAAFVLFPSSGEDSFQEVSRSLENEGETSAEAPAADSLGSTAPEQTVTTASAAADSAVADDQAFAGDTPLSVYETHSVELDELLKSADGAIGPEAAQRQLSSLDLSSTVSLDRTRVDECLSDLGADIPEGVVNTTVLGADVEDNETTVHVGFDFGSGVEDGLSFVLETCEIVEHAPQG
jgi:hypothetical protein